MSSLLPRNSISGTYVQLLYDYLAARGHMPDEVLGVPWPSSDPTVWVDNAQWQTLLEQAAIRLDDPLLGLHLGKTIGVRHLGILGAVMQACPNVGESLLRFDRYQRLIYDVSPLVMRTGEEWMEIGWDIRQRHSGALAEQTGLAVMVQFMRDLLRGELRLQQVRFSHPAPPNPQPLMEWFGCPLEFESSDPALRFPPALLTLPLKTPDLGLANLLEQHADRLMAQLPQLDEIVRRVRKSIARALRGGEPQIEAIAAEFHCSARTLQRRLVDAGSSFRDERNLVRKELALSYLGDPLLQIVDVALLLGYSEHSTFTRAFKEWYGQTPLQMREQLKALKNPVPVPHE